AEKGRTSVTEGVPMALPALILASTLQRRAARAGLPDHLDDLVGMVHEGDLAGIDRHGLGARLFDLVGEARESGEEAEAALRAVCRVYRDALLAAESG
ncbi:MAG TPA: hypothetical protein VIS06_19025, partial [Mycobacteriales bacterium]